MFQYIFFNLCTEKNWHFLDVDAWSKYLSWNVYYFKDLGIFLFREKVIYVKVDQSSNISLTSSLIGHPAERVIYV